MRNKNAPIVARALAFAVLGVIFSAIQQVTGAGFVAVSPMNNARNFHTATLLLNGKVLVAGGYGGTGVSAELYDPATDAWTVSGSLHVFRTHHAATLLPNGKVLVTGAEEPSTSTELYDPATGKWTLTGSMNRARHGPAAILLPNGKVLVVGGTAPAGSSELYDPATGNWTATGSASVWHHTLTLLSNGKVLGTGDPNTGELYDPTTGTWSTTGSPSRSYYTATLLRNGKVLAAGGARAFTAELYDPDTGTWSATTSPIWDRDYCTATLLHNGQVLVAGGLEQGPDIGIPSAELYDPTTATWTETPLGGVRFEHTATLLPNGKVLVAGGNDLPQLLSSVELYEPDQPPSLMIFPNADQTVTISWTGPGTLQQTERLALPDWQPAPSQDNPQTISTAAGTRFYRTKAE